MCIRDSHHPQQFARQGMSVEILGRHKRRHKKYVGHASNLAARNLKKCRRKRNAGTKAGERQFSAFALRPAGNRSYRLLKHPLLMYISSVSQPTDVLKIQVASEKTRTSIPAFSKAEDPRSPMKALLRLFCFVVLLLLVRQSGFAQGAATGDLHVSVKDPKGSVVTNATVTVRNVAKGLERAGSSDGQGGYSVRQLAPGTYSVSVDASGFARTCLLYTSRCV